MKIRSLCIVAVAFLVLSCSQHSQPTLPSLSIPQEGLVELGHQLFFDKKLSFNGTKSCASCHDPALAFTDGYRHSIGATGDLHMRNASSLLNVVDNKFFTAADPKITSLEAQIRNPLFNEQVIELGSALPGSQVLQNIATGADYQDLWGHYRVPLQRISWDLIIQALASYCAQLTSYNSKYDQFIAGKVALSVDEMKGRDLFFSSRLGCSECHGGKNFNQPKDEMNAFARNGFFNPRESQVETHYPVDTGVELATRSQADRGRFRIPSLRNVVRTGPYMHDGGVQSLREVISIYAKGGMTGSQPSSLVKGFSVSEEEMRDLMKFLDTLTDESYRRLPLFNP